MNHAEKRIRREKIAQAMRDGHSVEDVASIFKVSKATITNVMHEFGVDRNGNKER
jgi:transposase